MIFNKQIFVTNNPEPPPENPYLTFSSEASFTLKTNNTSKNWDGIIQYSFDGSSWLTWNGSLISAIEVSNEYIIFLRGTENTYITGDYDNGYFVISGTDVYCSGNIETLLDYETVESGQHPTMVDCCYRYMFYNCTSLKSAPNLPALETKIRCYANMFEGCTGLTTAPKILATTFNNYCCAAMFYGCTSLTTAPGLHATTIAQYGCSQMFEGCTALTNAPELPATTLARDCYRRMFYGCTSLTTAPELPATTVYAESYDSMFAGCNSLTEPPELPATTLGTYCYASMFARCALLEKISKLPATTLAESCYAAMFASCPNVKISATQTGDYVYPFRIPTEGTATSANNCTNNMFMNTGGTYKGNGPINYTYYTDHEPV